MKLKDLLLLISIGSMLGCALKIESEMSREDLKAIKLKVAEYTTEEVREFGVKPGGDVVAYTDHGPEYLVLRKTDKGWKVVGKEHLSSLLPQSF